MRDAKSQLQDIIDYIDELEKKIEHYEDTVCCEIPILRESGVVTKAIEDIFYGEERTCPHCRGKGKIRSHELPQQGSI